MVAMLPSPWVAPARAVATIGFFALFWNMFVVTLLGLFYLTDRIHRS
jgi:hypothetical protein